MNFKVVPIKPEIASEVRRTQKSPQYGHPAFVSVANGYGPCRSCLRTFEQGADERVLFTYNAFAGLADLPSPSPIFVHQENCQPFDQNEFPPDLRGLPILFEAFAENGEMMRREKPANDEIENLITRIFAASEVKYIHIRNAEAGCFIARIERN